MLLWQPEALPADEPPPTVVMLIPSGQRATLLPYVTSVRLYLRDLDVRFETRSVDGPAQVDHAASVAREEKARLVFWSSPSVSSVTFYYPEQPGNPVERRLPGGVMGEERSIEAFSLVVYAAVSAVLEGHAGSRVLPENSASDIQDPPLFRAVPSIDESAPPRAVSDPTEGGDETSSNDGEASEPTGENGVPSEDTPQPFTNPRITIQQRSVTETHDRVLLDLGYRLSIHGVAPPVVHGVDIVGSVRLTSTFAVFLGYGLTVQTRIREAVSFDIHRYPALLGGQLWVRRSRFEMGGGLTVSIGYVKPEVRTAPPTLGWVDTEGHLALSVAAQAAFRLRLWQRLWSYAALGAEIPVLYREYAYLDEDGEERALTDSWPVRPLFSLGVSVVLY